jgi:peptide/nickel transport system permease protein
VGAYILRRLGASLIVLFVASVIIFSGVRALPGDPARVLAGEDPNPEAIAQIRAKYGLDLPMPVQYVRWVTLALQGDLGESVRTGLDVTETVVGRLPITIELAFLSLLISIALGVPAGILAAVKRGSVTDYLSSAVALFGLSIPSFWLGLMLILLLAVYVQLFPASGYVPFFENPLENLRRMLLPAFVLGSGLAGVLMRQMRSAMLESLSADYVRTARSKGLSEREVIGVHALRNSLVTVVTVVGLQLGVLISGAVVTEQIFVIPGFGKLTVDAVFQRDFPVIQAVALFTTVGYILINLMVDVLYSVLNPRIRISDTAR